ISGGSSATHTARARNDTPRRTAQGTLVSSFHPATGTKSNARALPNQPASKIIIGGSFITYNGTGRNRIARLNADGTLDTGFNPGTAANGSVFPTASQPDGNITIGGSYGTNNGTGPNHIARHNADRPLRTSLE